MDTWDNHASSGYAGGNGTTEPYRIETPAQLAYFAKQSRTTTLSGSYSLEKSLDMSEYLWLGIGSKKTPFCGYFEGNFNTISGITMCVTDNALGSSIGFFNCIQATYSRSVSIYNVILNEGKIVSAFPSVGCLVGEANVYIESGVYPNYPDYSEVDVGSCIVKNYTVINSSNSISGVVCDPNGNDFQYEEDGELIDDYVWVNITNCMVKNCEFIATSRDLYIGGMYTGGNYVYTSQCAVVDVTFINIAATGRYYPIGWYDYYILDSYANVTYLNTATGVRQVVKNHGIQNNSSRSNWFFSPSLNKGYPVQTVFLNVASVARKTNSEIYNQLLALGFTAE